MWRSLLFVPVLNDRLVERAARRGADAIVLDLEAAVPQDRKEEARAALAVVKELCESNAINNAAELGHWLLTQFKERLADNTRVVDIRGKGLMLGIELSKPCGGLVDQARARGLLINVTAGNTIRLLPPLLLTADQAAYIVTTIVDLIEAF